MKIDWSSVLSAVATTAIMLGSTGVSAAEFQQGSASDTAGKPLVIGICYLSQDVAKPVSLGPTTTSVAMNTPVNGQALPLIVMPTAPVVPTSDTSTRQSPWTTLASSWWP